jgi:hypothetical protein
MEDHQMQSHDPLRRVVLRGALAAGCTLGMPMLLGCQQEQAQDTGDTRADAPAAPSASPDSGNAEAKLSQEQAQYQDSPKGEEKCGNCQHFIAESNTCRVVAGEVSPEGWCTLWTRQV